MDARPPRWRYARSAGPVIDDDLLAKSLRQEWTNGARDDVGRNAGSIADDDPHRSRRIGLRVCDLAYTRERNGTGETQELSAGKCHGMPYELEQLPRHAINHIQQPPECPLLAQSGHRDPLNQCPLLGVKRTLRTYSNVRF